MADNGNSVRDSLVAAIPNLRAFAISLTGDHHRANDLVQDTLLKAWAHRDKFEIGTNLKAWLFTILRNTYFSDIRKRRRELQDVDGQAAAQLVSLPEQNGHLDLDDFRRALSTLSGDQREALLLVGAEGYSYEEAAAIAGCAVGTVKSRVNRARAHLSQILNSGNTDHDSGRSERSRHGRKHHDEAQHDPMPDAVLTQLLKKGA